MDETEAEDVVIRAVIGCDPPAPTPPAVDDELERQTDRYMRWLYS